MPAKKQLPWSDDELIEMYKSRNTREIAEMAGVSQSLICDRLKTLGVEVGAHTQLIAPKYECPFSVARLRELHWVLGWTQKEIVAEAARIQGWEKIPHYTVARRWIVEAGLSVRGSAEAQGVKVRRHPEKARAHALHMVATRPPGSNISSRAFQPGDARTKRIQRKGIRLAAEKKRRERQWETRICQWCRCEITKPAKMFRNPPERTTCSKSCTNRLRWATQKGKSE